MHPLPRPPPSPLIIPSLYQAPRPTLVLDKVVSDIQLNTREPPVATHPLLEFGI